ncbi:MarR family winged helix-turn-helix transcriptional regulator [Nonomuraea jabiensis]|uniref:DNA-binding MarR family transcriptional regulator n=1 Tax=Nonomuraea jabiensis TaxID=882448 RepID=A0A7W9LGK0_9ACTN|nr:MarR family transcriptional regulator [Nonomuraea jabiensis]MBB5782982.1 DNA-binding MarR family transcriptional regulator [Nonomuraea jabiensis]
MDEVLEFVLAIKAAHREINRRFGEALRPLGITVVQAEAILVLAEDEPLSLKELGARLIAEAGNPSRLIDRLDAAGLVRRTLSREDRRQVELALTERGHEMARRVREARRPLLDWGRELLDEHEFVAASTALRRLLDRS